MSEPVNSLNFEANYALRGGQLDAAVDELQKAINAQMDAAIQRDVTVSMLGGLGPSPTRDRVEALYDGFIAAGYSDDGAMGEIVAIFQAEEKLKGILAETGETP